MVTPFGPVECWLELVNVGNGVVTFAGHNVFTDTDEVVVSRSGLRLRTLIELVDSLNRARFTVDHVFGGWDHSPVDGGSPDFFVFIARRS